MTSRRINYPAGVGIALSCFALLTPAGLCAQSLTENDLLLRVRSAEANCRGALGSVRNSILEDVARSVDKASMDVASAVVEGLNDRPFYGMWDFAPGIYQVAPCGRIDLEEGRRGDPAAVFYELTGVRGVDSSPGVQALNHAFAGVTFFKDYQDKQVRYITFVSLTNPAISNLRTGQKVTARITVLRVEAGGEGLTVRGKLESIIPETTMLRCANGHTYAPASGYRFCPVDGLPLK
jgi:hypothetical protein